MISQDIHQITPIILLRLAFSSAFTKLMMFLINLNLIENNMALAGLIYKLSQKVPIMLRQLLNLKIIKEKAMKLMNMQTE